MKPVIAIIGRPNVGKSTLFNRLTMSRDALVADYPGLTRDRIYGQCKIGPRPAVVIDTGGFSEQRDELTTLVCAQSLQAAAEADAIIFMVDAKAGLAKEDFSLAERLRRLDKPVYLAVNKTEGNEAETAVTDFYQLGLGQPIAISSARGDRVAELMETVAASLPAAPTEDPAAGGDNSIRLAVIGRPNVGKSTLVNRMLGEDRMVVCDLPGTTRDCVFIPFQRHGRHYTLIDTAGVRRRSKIAAAIEKFSVIKTLQAIDQANVVVVVIDANERITDQDSTLLGMVLQSGRSLILAVNKWDGLESAHKAWIQKEIERKLKFVKFAAIHFISALHGSGVGDMFQSINKAYDAAFADINTSTLTRILEEAASAHPPPVIRGRRIKLKYAHLGGQNPPRIIIHGNQIESVPDSYKRYIERYIRKCLNLQGTPVKIEFKQGDNPFAERKNKLTRRQITKRQRLLKYIRHKH